MLSLLNRTSSILSAALLNSPLFELSESAVIKCAHFYFVKFALQVLAHVVVVAPVYR